MKIPLWSENHPDAEMVLSPIRDTEWDTLSHDDKALIWKHLEHHLFNSKIHLSPQHFSGITCRYEFFGKDMWENEKLAKRITFTMFFLNDKYKKQSYARKFLNDGTFDSACEDFHRIFLHEPRDVVFQMISYLANLIVNDEYQQIQRINDEGDEEFENRKDTECWTKFDRFSYDFNEVINSFGINYQLTRAGIIPTDEPVVVEKIYQPVLKKLASKKWDIVNRDLKDAFQALADDDTGSGSLTHILAALQGFLQILVNGEPGKGETAQLIKSGTQKGLIPNDDFSKQVITNMNSFWAKERQEKGDPHPKKSYATKEQAKLVISLVMVFVDHVL